MDDSVEKTKNKLNSFKLRELAFNSKFNDFEKFNLIGDYGIYGAIMEMGYAQGFITVACFVSGDASIYFSNGGGIMGGIGREPVRKASFKFVHTALNFITDFKKTKDYPFPQAGQTTFYIFAKDGIYSANAMTSEFKPNGPHPFTPLFATGQNVITECRLIAQNEK